MDEIKSTIKGLLQDNEIKTSLIELSSLLQLSANASKAPTRRSWWEYVVGGVAVLGAPAIVYSGVKLLQGDPEEIIKNLLK